MDRPLIHSRCATGASILVLLALRGFSESDQIMKRRAISTILIFALFGSLGAAELPKRQDNSLRLAIAAEDRGDFQRAIELHKGIAQRDPTNWRSLNSIAGLYGKLGKFEEEIEWAKKAQQVNTDKTNELPAINMGNGYLGEGNLPQAMFTFVAAITINPHSAIGHYSLGVLHERTGDLERAEVNYKNSLAADPAFKDSYFNLAALMANEKRYDEAAEYIQHYLQLDPNDPDAKEMLKHINKDRERLKP